MDGSDWEFNNFLMFLMVLGYSTETDMHFFSVSPFCAKTIHAVYFLLFFLLEQSRLALKSSFFLRVCVKVPYFLLVFERELLIVCLLPHVGN